jgi:hypothetical protein
MTAGTAEAVAKLGLEHTVRGDGGAHQAGEKHEDSR